MDRGSEILRRIFQYTAARDVLHYLHREIEKTIFFKEDRCEKVVDANDGRAWRFLSGEISRGVRLPREIVIMPS